MDRVDTISKSTGNHAERTVADEGGFEIGDYISVSCENGKLIIDYYATL